jgi:hypothetical protein
VPSIYSGSEAARRLDWYLQAGHGKPVRTNATDGVRRILTSMIRALDDTGDTEVIEGRLEEVLGILGADPTMKIVLAWGEKGLVTMWRG